MRSPAVTDDSLSTHLDRATLEPDPAFTAQANGTQDMYAAAEADHEGFWAEQGRKYVTWAKDFDTTLDWSQAPFAPARSPMPTSSARSTRSPTR
jgi:acetyl-CoA synthetase